MTIWSFSMCAVLPGAWDRTGCFEHAVALGAGAEALLGRVEGALVQGHGGSGAAYAAARRFGVTSLDYIQMGLRFCMTDCATYTGN